jgi:hypothetical protein
MAMTDRLPKTDLFDFGGSFFPSDSLVVFFDTEADARAVCAEINSLLPDAACEIFTPRKIEQWATDGLDNAGFVASLGYGIQIVAKHQELARAGKWSLIAFAPSEEATEIAMSAVRKKRFHQANKYNTVTVEDLV